MFPIELPRSYATTAFTSFPSRRQNIYNEALHDKKRAGNSIDLVVPRAIGAVSIAPTPLDEFKKILEVGLACVHAYAGDIEDE